MKNTTVLLFPNQLFYSQKLINDADRVILVEDAHFFCLFKFHKQKLIFHRASMRAYAQLLETRNIEVIYIEHTAVKKDLSRLFEICHDSHIKDLHYFDPVDHQLSKKIQITAKKYSVKLTYHENPSFMLSSAEVLEILGDKKRFMMASFYTTVRKKFNILMAGSKPIGGKWSYDAQNRQALPDHITIPPTPRPNQNSFITEATDYVETHFPNNPGNAAPFIYPITHEHSNAWLNDFLHKKLVLFGPYQDAVRSDLVFGFHSLLSPLLNSGLLMPHEVVEKTIEFAKKHNVPINSVEGFIRQIIGWREFVRGVYMKRGEQQRTSNFFKHTKKLPPSFWVGNTGIEPLDTTIKKILQYAYAHHIERLMILGNFMLIAHIHPDDVYTWFMEMFIDAYDWVMVPNVYGMSQYADGGLMTTKPYSSSSKYILKMSNYKRGPWCTTWDGLYWKFIHKHASFLSKNGRLSFVATALKKMKPEVLQKHLKSADQILKTLKEK